MKYKKMIRSIQYKVIVKRKGKTQYGIYADTYTAIFAALYKFLESPHTKSITIKKQTK